MPTVARATRQVSLDPIAGTRKRSAETDISTGAGYQQAKADVGQQVSRIGDTLTRVGIEQYTKMQDEARKAANQTLELKWSNGLSEWETKRVYGPGGAFSIEGEEAQKLPEDIRAEFDAVAADLGQSATTEEQKFAFERLKSQRWQSLNLDIQRHVYEEGKKFAAREYAAAVVNGVEDAKRRYSDPAGMGRSLEALEQKINAQPGLTPEQRTQQIRAVRSETYLGAIDNILADKTIPNGAAQARILFASVEDQIDPDKLDDTRDKLKEGSTRAAAQNKFDTILAQGGTLAEQRAKAKQIEDADERDAVLSYLEHEHQVNEQQQRQVKEDRDLRVADVIDRTKSVRSLEGTEDWHNMSRSERSEARHYAAFIAGGGVGNPSGEDADLKAYYGLRDLATTNPDEFVKVNLHDITKGVKSASYRKQLMDLQFSMRKGDGSADEKIEEYFTTNQVFATTATSLKLKDGTPGYTRLRSRFESALRAESPDKKLPIAKQQEILDRLSIDVVTEDGYIWDTTKKGFEVTIDDVPTSERALIVDALRRAGRAVNEETILDTFLRQKQRKK